MSALIFDLDGTLVDSVYEHVAAWHLAFIEHGVTLPAFEYHKRVGMTGSLLVQAVDDAFSLGLTAETRAAIELAEATHYRELRERVQPVPGVLDLWHALATRNVCWAIATSAGPDDAHELLEKIGAPKDAVVVTKAEETKSKPSPEPFAVAARKLGVHLHESIVVGDAVWDMLSSRRAGALGVGVLTGGYSREELVGAGAYRVYANAGELAHRLGELGL